MTPPADSPELQEILFAITEYANEVTGFSEPGERASPALALLKIATHATKHLNRIWQECPHVSDEVEDCFSSIAPQLEFWPVPFNEVEDLSPYKKLKIGYDRLDSKNPRARTGHTVFSFYARVLVERMCFLRDDALATRIGKKWAGYHEHQAKKRLHEWVTQLRVAINAQEPAEPWAKVRTFRPTCLSEIEALPTLSAKSATLWRDTGKNFFKEAFPQCEEINDLACQINDTDVTRESQIRAQIIERVGRAIVALAR